MKSSLNGIWPAVAAIVLLLNQCSVAQTTVRVAWPNLRFNAPVDLRVAPGDPSHIYIVEQGGTIRLIDANDRTATTAPLFMNITSAVRSGGELGLLGMAFDPDFADNHLFYLYYTASNPLRVVVSRFATRADDPLKGDTASERVLLEIPEPYENHDGGSIAFGPDGYLYLGIGDGGNAGDPGNRAQNTDSLLGKILRIDVHPSDTTRAYDIPPDNPFADSGGRSEIYAWGLRNPWRFSFDAQTGDLWCGDVGQDAWEEIDIIRAGENYGWRVMEGFHCFNPGNCDSAGFARPVIEYPHAGASASVTGGYVNRAESGGIGDNGPVLPGEYVYADFVFGTIWGLRLDSNGTVYNRVIDTTSLNISSFGVDANRHLYFCAFDGRIYEFVAASGVPIHSDVAGARVIPDPATDHAALILELRRSGSARVDFVNMAGEIVRSITNTPVTAGRNVLNLDLTSMPTGPYRWSVSLGDDTATGSIVIVR